MAAAVVRVKRHCDEEPLEALVLNCKRRKIDNSDIEPINTESCVLKFAGTIQEDENVITHLQKQRIPELQELKEQFKRHTVKIYDKLRTQQQEISKNNRYRIVNCFRSESLDDNPLKKNASLETSKSEYTIFDVETDLNKNDKTDNQNEEMCKSKYVYDLYYTNSDDFGDTEVAEYISIYPLSDPLMLGSHRDNRLNGVDSDDDSDDSNAENNWRNDYPDESDMESINEDDMREAMENLDIDEDVLSSDDEAAGCDEDVDESIVLQNGKEYAKFKAKYTKFLESSGPNNNCYYKDIESDEDYYW